MRGGGTGGVMGVGPREGGGRAGDTSNTRESNRKSEKMQGFGREPAE